MREPLHSHRSRPALRPALLDGGPRQGAQHHTLLKASPLTKGKALLGQCLV